MPALISDYSVSNFNLGADGKLSGTIFTSSDDSTEVAKLTDDNTMNTYSDSSNPCHFGMKFKDDQVGVLTEVKFFIGRVDNYDAYVGNLEFQGSNSGSSYKTIFTVDENAHEGWNVHEIDSDATSY